MFSLEKFEKQAHEGQKVDIEEFCGYVQNFDSIILWGAGNLGRAVGEKFQKLNIKIDTYWDANYMKLAPLLGIDIIETFTGDFDKEKTLVVFCIGNVPVGPTLMHMLRSKGWKNILNGNTVLQGVLCPFDCDSEFDAGICNNWDVCSVCACDRLMNIVKSKSKKKDSFALDRVHFIVNNYCNLKCTHCNRYMNSYPNNKKINLNPDIIKSDIKRVMGAIDTIGVVILFGGETFLHPQIEQVVEAILEHDNFGALLVNTNGIANIKDEQLKGLEDRRVRVAYSNYMQAITDAQKEKFYENLNYMQDKGICAQAQKEVPTWFIPSTLKDNHVSEEKMVSNRKACDFPYLFVYDHKVFPCTMALTIYDLGIADYTTDYVDIEKMKTDEELREAIKEMMGRKYYRTCGHCDDTGGVVNAAGEQGFNERYVLPIEEK